MKIEDPDNKKPRRWKRWGNFWSKLNWKAIGEWALLVAKWITFLFIPNK